jgi:hypothetical protein
MANSDSTKCTATYGRVFTDGKTTENQLRELRQVAERRRPVSSSKSVA